MDSARSEDGWMDMTLIGVTHSQKPLHILTHPLCSTQFDSKVFTLAPYWPCAKTACMERTGDIEGPIGRPHKLHYV